MTIARTALLTLLLATPASAQSPATATAASTEQFPRPVVTRPAGPVFSLRAVGMVTVQGFSAQTTFDGIFGTAVGPFWGGGAQVVMRNGWFGDVSVSRFHKTGERAFLFTGEVTRLGLPLTATITPVEVTGGYRFKWRKHRTLIPYLGAGVGSYGYKESSQPADPGENVNTRHVGYLGVGGVEYRVHRLIGAVVDVQYTHIPGILGSGGLSEQAKEHDLGGTAVRFRVVVGR
jgi:hypothetical protein